VSSGNLDLAAGNLQTTGNVDAADANLTGNLSASGDVNATNGNFSGAVNAVIKNFDIEHPAKKEPWRLRYSVLEGPEIGVYLRGRLTNTNVIEMPYYWTDLVHEESITVSLTPIGNFGQYFIEKIEGNLVYVGSASGYIDLYYIIIGERKDVKRLVVEYKKEN
jgi:hypothetical protein